MLGKDFTDKVTEYRILNEQLMSKALALLKTADDLMIESESESDDENKSFKTLRRASSKAKASSSDFESATFEYSKSFDDTKQNCTDTDVMLNDSSVRNEAFDAFIQTKNKVKSKFIFPIGESEKNKSSLTFASVDDLNDSSFDDGDNDEANDTNGINGMIDRQEESDYIVRNLLSNKFVVQNNVKNGAKSKYADIHQVENVSKINDQCVKALKMKIDSLQEDMRSCQDSLKKKTVECDKLFKDNQALLETKTKLNAQLNTLKSQNIKKDEKILNLNSKIQANETESRSVKNEHESLIKTTKQTAQDISNAEVKLSRATKEIATLKETINVCKNY
ncbi:uncharacterized protein LOC143915588 [Arctopsyche grandis]|uniref:uncharacterized protein LOC143915588 n=1 Tax=Arctopsyche grandis TaxID=121162 RepID=UPI00406D7326